MKPSYGTVALLPMKANSERVPGKNFRTFAGKPLFRWILDTLLEIELIEAIVINTDARDILAAHGLLESDRVLIRDRKDELCGGEVSMNKVLKDDLDAIDSSTYLMTHTTNPLVTASTIDDAIKTYQRETSQGRADSLFTVSQFQSRFYDEAGQAINHDPKNLLRTQDLPPLFEENSNLYLFSRSSFASTNARIGAKPTLMTTPFMESFDIDDTDGWNLAELVALDRLGRRPSGGS